MTPAVSFWAALSSEPRFPPVIELIADYGAIRLVQRVMYDAPPTKDFHETAFAAENARLALPLREPRTPLGFSVRPGPRCSWPRRTRRRPSARACGHSRRTWHRRQRRAQVPAMTVMRSTMTSHARRAARLSNRPFLGKAHLEVDHRARLYDQGFRGAARLRAAHPAIARIYYDPDEDAHAPTPPSEQTNSRLGFLRERGVGTRHAVLLTNMSLRCSHRTFCERSSKEP